MTFLRSRLFWIAAVVVVIAALLPFWLSAYLLGILTAAYYFGVFAMAWDLLFGFAGEVNFGPTFLIGLGAYTAAILNAINDALAPFGVSIDEIPATPQRIRTAIRVSEDGGRMTDDG